MPEDELTGKLTIIVESTTRSTKQLDQYFQRYLEHVPEKYCTIYIVPSDEVPYE